MNWGCRDLDPDQQVSSFILHQCSMKKSGACCPTRLNDSPFCITKSYLIIKYLFFKEKIPIFCMQRILGLDVLKGFAIILMVIFNYSVTLAYFGLLNLTSNFLYWFVFPRFIAGIFVFVSGAAAFTSFKSSKKNFAKKYFSRGLKLLLFAALITVFTYIFTPQGTILFGILHFFAFSSFLLPFFVNSKRFNLIAGILITFLGFYLQFTYFGFSFLFWLGLMPYNFFTFDYFPLLPWVGVLMLGVYFSNSVVKKLQKMNFHSRFTSSVSFLGRHSLEIYLVHQPVLILILLALGYKLFF